MAFTEPMDRSWIRQHTNHTIPVAARRFGSWHIAISRQSPTSDELASRYDAVADTWRQTARRFNHKRAYARPLLVSGLIEALSQRSETPRVLDCGLGTASLTTTLDSLLPGKLAFHGIDVSADMLGTAKAELSARGLSAELQQADITAIPYPDATFDAVMAAHVIEHLPDPKRALEEMIRVVKPGGQVFVCLNRRSLFGAFIQLRWRTWAVTEAQGRSWLENEALSSVGSMPVSLGHLAGEASLAVWGRRPSDQSLNLQESAR